MILVRDSRKSDFTSFDGPASYIPINSSLGKSRFLGQASLTLIVSVHFTRPILSRPPIPFSPSIRGLRFRLCVVPTPHCAVALSAAKVSLDGRRDGLLSQMGLCCKKPLTIVRRHIPTGRRRRTTETAIMYSDDKKMRSKVA